MLLMRAPRPLTLTCRSFPCFLEFLVFFPCEELLVFLSVFLFVSRDFRGSVGTKNPCFFGGFPCLFLKNKESLDRVTYVVLTYVLATPDF